MQAADRINDRIALGHTVRYQTCRCDSLRPEKRCGCPYALEGLPNTVVVRKYMTVLPSEKLQAEEIGKARRAIKRAGRKGRVVSGYQLAVVRVEPSFKHR
jgi:hypothetical protein